MKIGILLFLFVGFRILFSEMELMSELTKTLRKTRSEMNAASRQRNLADRQNLLKMQERHSFWYRMEQTLQYSGIRDRFPQLSAEWFLLLQLVAGTAAFCVGCLLFDALVGAGVVGVLLWLELTVLHMCCRKNFRRTEEDLTKLLDFLGNYSVTSGEITGIFDQIGRYMEEPVRSALSACFYEASTTGDAQTALLAMAERIEHPKFKELARNMEITSRYCADFTALVQSSRRSLREYLRTVQERRSMTREATVNLVILMGMSVVVLLSVGKLTGIDMQQLLLTTWPGRIGLGLLGMIFLVFRRSVTKI